MEESTESIATNHFRFDGNATEFWGIWIVNLILTILTLGIYSAWAKVRTNRYFYGNTYLDDSAFEYTADPVKILKGRFLAAGLFIAIQLAGYVSPAVSNWAFLILMMCFPALMVMALRFRMHHSRWRGIRFAFRADFRSAYLLFLPFILYALMLGGMGYALPEEITQPNDQPLPEEMEWLLWLFMAAIFLPMLAFPWWQNRYYDFLANRTSFGQHAFRYSGSSLRFYGIYSLAGVIFAVGIGIGAAALSLIATQLLLPKASVLVGGAIMASAYAASIAYVLTARTNLIYNRVSIDESDLQSKLRYRRMFYLYLTNTLAIVASLGLAIPWAKIRMAKYRAETLSISGASLGVFAAGISPEEEATAEEMSDVFAWDFGL